MERLENTFKKHLLNIMGTRWDVQSHEDSLSAGIPDLSYGLAGVNGWIELKIIESWPKLAKTLAKPKKFTPQQVNWLRCRGKKGGNCYVFVKVTSEAYFLFDYTCARDVRHGIIREEYGNRALAVWYGSINVDQLIEILTKREER